MNVRLYFETHIQQIRQATVDQLGLTPLYNAYEIEYFFLHSVSNGVKMCKLLSSRKEVHFWSFFLS